MKTSERYDHAYDEQKYLRFLQSVWIACLRTFAPDATLFFSLGT